MKHVTSLVPCCCMQNAGTARLSVNCLCYHLQDASTSMA